MNRTNRDDFIRLIEEYLDDLLGAFNADGAGNVIRWSVSAADKTVEEDNESESESEEGHPPYQISYEIIESETYLFITIELPAILRYAPSVEVRTDQVVLYLDDEAINIPIPAVVSTGQSYYSTRHRIMDIICKKFD